MCTFGVANLSIAALSASNAMLVLLSRWNCQQWLV